jgi:hypothetical protein
VNAVSFTILAASFVVVTLIGFAAARWRPAEDPMHFGASTAPVFGHTTYIAITAVLLNLVMAAGLTLIFRALGVRDGYDDTRPADYSADSGPAPARAPARAPAGAPAAPAAAPAAVSAAP